MRSVRSSRREFLKVSGAAAVAPIFCRPLFAQTATGVPLHGLSAFGDLKYPPNFAHFDYASPEAPKGGTFNFQPSYWYYNQNVLTFNTLNSFVRTGDAPPRMEMCFDSLMAWAWDEPDAVYGLLAESVVVSDDRNSFTFRLRPEARFHDGSSVTAEDVAFSYDLLKDKGHPQIALSLSEMTSAEALGKHEFRLGFSGKQSERTFLSAVQFPVFSKAALRDQAFDSSRLEALLGSGPYKVGRFSAGRYIEYDRVEGYWARDLPVIRGLYHFDRIRIDFYRDRNAAFEAFKKGETLWREEPTSRLWATAYEFPAVTEGKVVKREIPSELRPNLQGWALNQRRSRFRDPRVREAIGLCFDFEWTNRNFFYGIYERSHSPFEQSEFKAEGKPSPEELAILERFRGQIPEAAFGEPFVPPVSNGSGRDRRLLSRAQELLAEAGWERKGQFLHNKAGERLTLEHIVRDEVFVQVTMPFIENLRAIGIDASIRLLDASQYQVRVMSFDYDMIGHRVLLAATPTRDSLELLFHSRAAAMEGSSNYTGTADPAIDGLVENAGSAKSRQELIVSMRALDRVLRARQDWIPNWHSGYRRVAHWDLFGFKEKKPDYFFPVEALWWYEREKA
ncbi:extracellular solute-binding protein [Chelativorans sp. Marseille-P2723]|uniref:extracellular solute-binding protein n=1 Tax=Chelativorans sp. Marseille-P2723 TaxID=2709133 RepID=UPI00156E5FFD|nr:extracellular solute-binding protein [Chelativorans sp. Marseille-P2723]